MALTEALAVNSADMRHGAGVLTALLGQSVSETGCVDVI